MKGAARGPGLALFAGMLVLLVALLAGVGFLMLRPKAPPPAAQPAADRLAMCRPCAALARFERATHMTLTRDPDLSTSLASGDRADVLDAITGWRKRCSVLLCSEPTKAGLACAAPPPSLLTELASIDQLSANLKRRTTICHEGGCQFGKCESAHKATAAFTTLGRDLRGLTKQPSALVSQTQQTSTGFMFDQLQSLDDTLLAAPSLIAQGRFAAVEGRLLFFRDEALQAEANLPDSAEGQLADRLDDVNAAIEAIAEGRRVGASGPGLAALWHDFGASAARLLVEAATLRAQMRTGPSLVQALLHPETAADQDQDGSDAVCPGTLKLIQMTEHRLAAAIAGLDLCNQRAACQVGTDVSDASTGDGQTAATPVPKETLQGLADGRRAAAATLASLLFQKDPQVTLATDLRQYFSGEAIAVKPSETKNRCLTDDRSRLVLLRRPAEGNGEVPVAAHRLDPADSARWYFDAPKTPGTYRLALETSKARGSAQFGASAKFAVTHSPSNDCTGFTGKWHTNFGELTIHVRGGIARGSYKRSDAERAGLLEGLVDGDTLTGTWYSELGKGGARLTLTPDGHGFNGTWGLTPKHPAGAGSWNGTCVGAVAPAAASAQPQG